MNDVHAFIVGIDCYAVGEEWHRAGPVLSACKVAELLLAAEVPAAQIHLFLGRVEDDDVQADVEGLAAKGVIVKGDGSYDKLEEFWREKLGQGVDNPARLIVFWSGHGFTDGQSRRIFMCSDYTNKVRHRVFNASNFARGLKGGGYPFTSQLFFADVCGTPANDRFVTADEECVASENVDQLIYFATPEGVYTRTQGGMGIFTSALIEALGDFRAWPDLRTFPDTLGLTFTQRGIPAYRISYQGPGGADEISVGKSVMHDRRGREAIACLEDVALDNERLRICFLKTIAGLELLELSGCIDKYGMVRALADCSDATEDQPSFGLIMFLTRVARVCPTERLGKWLEGVSVQLRTDADSRLDRERPVKRLLIRVRHDPGRLELSRFDTSLREEDLTFPAECHAVAETVTGWDDFSTRIATVVDDVANREKGSSLWLHFVADAPLFDLPFHCIPDGNGQAIGERFQCTVHYLQREHWGVPWDKYCTALDAALAKRVRMIPVSPSPAGLPVGHGLCYAEFPIVKGETRLEDKKRLGKVAQIGVPYLCWLHDASEDPQLCLGQVLDDLLDEAGALEKIPEALAARRLHEDPVANNLSLLWDYPSFRPYTPLIAPGGQQA